MALSGCFRWHFDVAENTLVAVEHYGSVVILPAMF